MRFEELAAIIAERATQQSATSYVAALLAQGENRIIQKVGEEAIEVVIAAKNNDREELINELSDLYMHLLVLMHQRNLTLNDIYDELQKRHMQRVG